MVLLTFSECYDELMDKSKDTTIRFNADYWENVFYLTEKLDMWWLNPRNRHPDCYKMGIARERTHDVRSGYTFTDEIARHDGFENVYQLWDTLERKHKMTHLGVLEHYWIIIDFRWLDGYPIRKVA